MESRGRAGGDDASPGTGYQHAARITGSNPARLPPFLCGRRPATLLQTLPPGVLADGLCSLPP